MPTALITGATAGIGAAFARRLARDGFDLVLVARTEERLRAIADELGPQVKTEVLVADLATDEGIDAVAARARDVDLLVNNAGFGTHGHFLEIDAKREAEMVRVNCEAVVTLTHAFLPAMVERGSGGVITVASTAGLQPIPYEATYSASKAFAIAFTEAVREEVKASGVKMLVVNPGPVKTEWQSVAGYDEDTRIMPGMITAERCVKDSLRAFDRGKRSVVTGRLFPWIMRATVAPKPVKLKVTERIYRPSG
jgi:short-subunit dehydrogenase